MHPPHHSEKHEHLPKERANFKELLLLNHFGTLPDSALEPAAKADGNTTYERLTCVGYHPLAKRLDATVAINQSSGYSGGICSAGSQEYVKFFTSTDGGASWTEQGTVSFTVWDAGGPKPLEFAARLQVDLEQECCRAENVVLVRAILSWAVPPGGPDDPVVWGNALDAAIQVAPLETGTIHNLLHCLKIDEIDLAGLVDPEQPVEFGPGNALTPLELHTAYAEKVEPHRYLLPHVQELLAAPATLTEKLTEPGFQLFPGVEGIDLAGLIGALLDPQGNQTYEQLGCVGLNSVSTELVATVDVKLSSGYSGGLCSAGSGEYVAFWVDWGAGAGWEYAGTSSVGVHDIAAMPADGLRYSVALPFPALFTHRRPCTHGPVTARVRAVLSWSTPPSASDPYAPVHWGGHLEGTILIPPGAPVVPGGGPHLETIGRMDVDDIDAATGLATGFGQGIGFAAVNSPFGGQVWFSGHVFNRFAAAFGGPGIHYRIWISTDGGANWDFMSTEFHVTRHDYGAGTTTSILQTPVTLTGAGPGWYRYLEDSAALVTVDENTLGYWQSAGDGHALIYMEARDTAGTLGMATPQKRLRLDNTPPTAQIAITSGPPCGDFFVGGTISGTYAAADNERLSGVGFSLEPPPAAGTFTLGRAPASVTATAEAGTWTLNTQPPGTPGLPPCGYVLRFDGVDNTIVDSARRGFDTPAFAGFCLKRQP